MLPKFYLSKPSLIQVIPKNFQKLTHFIISSSKKERITKNNLSRYKKAFDKFNTYTKEKLRRLEVEIC